MKSLLILLFVSSPLYAQYNYDIPEEELNPETEDVLLRKPEKFLRNESMIYDFNTDLGIKDQRRYTGQDRNRFSVAGHISADYEHFNDILGIDFSYMRRSTSYRQAWYGFQFYRNRTFFDNITQNRASTGANSEGSLQRPNNVENSVMAAGLGMGYRFKLLLDFFEAEDVFESVDVFANYVTLDEEFVGQTYNGWGLTTNYGIHKRSSSNYFYGGKLSYNLAVVTRDAIADESKDDRSLSLGWLSLAFEIGFFY